MHVAATYPFTAPNGSEIIVCGHDKGLYILWRGGRPFHPKAWDADQSNMSAPTPATFAEKHEDFDPRKPYLPIVQDLDIPVGDGVLDLAFPRLPCLSDPAERDNIEPALLRQKMVIALACADGSINLMTIPLAPPAPAAKQRRFLRENPLRARAGQGSWGEVMFGIQHRPHGHQGVPKGVSVGFARTSALEGDDDDQDTDMDGGADKAAGVDLLIASHSADLGGMLIVHRIHVSKDGRSLSLPSAELVVYRRQRLASPASSVDLYVPPLGTPAARRHPPRILITSPGRPVQIFTCATPNHPNGIFSLALSPGLVSSPSARPVHRRVLAARWVLAGRAVAALMADGEWGVWDVTPPSQSAPVRGISAAIPTPFSLTGRVGGLRFSSVPTPPKKSSSSESTSGSALAPMTPGTRRVRQEALFAQPSSSGRSSTGSASNDGADIHGGVSIHLLDSQTTGRGPDEFVLFWHGARAAAVPSLRAQWDARLRPSSAGGLGATTATGSKGLHVRDVPAWHADLRGDHAVAVVALPGELAETQAPGQGPAPELVVVGERGVAVLASPLSEPQLSGNERAARRQRQRVDSGKGESQEIGAQDTTSNGDDWRPKVRDKLEEQLMLDKGMLDLDQVEGVLDRMAKATPNANEDGDGDMVMDLPEQESPSVRTRKRRVEFRT